MNISINCLHCPVKHFLSHFIIYILQMLKDFISTKIGVDRSHMNLEFDNTEFGDDDRLLQVTTSCRIDMTVQMR